MIDYADVEFDVNLTCQVIFAYSYDIQTHSVVTIAVQEELLIP